MIIIERVKDSSGFSGHKEFDAEKAKGKWLEGLTEGERVWADQGLLLEGDQTDRTSVSITGLNGEIIEIIAEGLKIGGNTLMIPATKKAQSIHGKTKLRIKRNY